VWICLKSVTACLVRCLPKGGIRWLPNFIYVHMKTDLIFVSELKASWLRIHTWSKHVQDLSQTLCLTDLLCFRGYTYHVQSIRMFIYVLFVPDVSILQCHSELPSAVSWPILRSAWSLFTALTTLSRLTSWNKSVLFIILWQSPVKLGINSCPTFSNTS
jgi:hypothetical protein